MDLACSAVGSWSRAGWSQWLGGGARVRAVGNGRQQCLATYIARHYLE